MIHFLNGFKRTIAVPNNVLVPQMKISSEPNVWHDLSLLDAELNSTKIPYRFWPPSAR
jgi:hypothetical protein